ncbi:MAG: glucosaminidase domain-containing protein [Bacilli bacterium]
MKININYKLILFCFFIALTPFFSGEVKADINYGIVNFKTKTCNNNTSYIEFSTGRSGYTNGCSSADGVYLGNENGKVKFMQSGVVGLVNPWEVNVIDMDYYESSTWITSYKSVNGVLQHCISNDTNNSKYDCIELGPDTIGLPNKAYFLSYDGHYFYRYNNLNDFKIMVNDLKIGSHSNAINANNPYYNYYQFLSHRTKTNQTVSDLNNYITNSSNKMYNLGSAFIDNQNIYGSNGALMFGTAGNESAWGTSGYAKYRNNLFGHNAFDSNPNEADYYDSPATSVYFHAKGFVSEGYMDPCDWKNTGGNGFTSICLQGRYYGPHLGNKASGMNVKYASDPYWGEKAAGNFYTFEKAVGQTDYGYYTIGIKTKFGSYAIRKEATTNSSILYRTTNSTDFPFIILSKVNGEYYNGSDIWYKIQADPTLDSSRNKLIQDQGAYNFDNNYGYIHASVIDVYLPGSKPIEDTTSINYDITFNTDGGYYSDKTISKTIKVKKDIVPSVETPTKTGYTFNGWSPNVASASCNKTYVALWIPNVYDINFDATNGLFSDNLTSKIVKTKYNELPIIEEPTLAGYTFNGWSPNISKVNKTASYKATWKKEEKPDETGLVQKDGNFYFEYLKEIDNKLVIKGYNTINRINNDLNTKITYKIIFESLTDSTKKYEQNLSRIIDANDLGRPAIGDDNYNYTYSWFEGSLDINKLPAGDYKVYIVSETDKFYSKSVINNPLYKPQVTDYADLKYAIIRNDYSSNIPYIEFIIRDTQLGKKETNAIYSQYDQFRTMNLDNSGRLSILGYSYSYGTDYSIYANVDRKIIFENISNFTKYEYNIGSVIDGLFKISLPSSDGYDKTRAWYRADIDLTNMLPGKYAIYISNSTNVADIGELKDLLYKSFDDLNKVVKNKKYKFIRNDNNKHRIELIIENV